MLKKFLLSIVLTGFLLSSRSASAAGLSPFIKIRSERLKRSMSAVSQVQLKKHIPTFSNLSPAERKRKARLAESVRVREVSSPIVSTKKFEEEVIALVNKERAQEGLVLLKHESHLQAAAFKHAQDMEKRDFFSHINPEGETPTDLIRAAGYPLTGRWLTGQNIAKGHKTPEAVMQGWMLSEGHKNNILSPEFREIGIGISGRVWVQNFGRHGSR